MSAHLLQEYPAILGRTYKPRHQDDWPEVTLEYADINQDLFRLKDPSSPWIFECNYATFSFYWQLKEHEYKRH